MSYFHGKKTNSFLVMTHVHLGHETNILQNMGPCNSDYNELCNDVCLCVLNSAIDRYG